MHRPRNDGIHHYNIIRGLNWQKRRVVSSLRITGNSIYMINRPSWSSCQCLFTCSWLFNVSNCKDANQLGELVVQGARWCEIWNLPQRDCCHVHQYSAVRFLFPCNVMCFKRSYFMMHGQDLYSGSSSSRSQFTGGSALLDAWQTTHTHTHMHACSKWTGLGQNFGRRSHKKC